jgi:hypothetical protein
VRITKLAAIVSLYRYEEQMNGYVLHTLYSVHVYLALELVLAAAATASRALVGLERMNGYVLLTLYSVHVYLALELVLMYPFIRSLYRYSDTMAASFVILTCFIEIFNFLRNKTISNNKTEYTIAKSSSRRSKLIYYLLYLEIRIKRY